MDYFSCLAYNRCMIDINQVRQLKKEILIKLVEAFYSDDFAENARRIPFLMRPRGCEVPYRCCIHKERAILRDRILAGLGFSIENSSGMVSLSTYAKEALKREKPEEHILTVLPDACQGCVPSKTYITDLCKGCVARQCMGTCNFSAIRVEEGRAIIDPDKCKNCGRCENVCPYSAIIKVRVPCEEICPVDAIAKDGNCSAAIDFEKCISCGRCVGACPFGAIHEKSQIVDILNKIKQGKKVVALIAPSAVGQFQCTIGQLKHAIKQTGFYDAHEVAYGADITALHEGGDFKKRIAQGDNFMTTSCCNAYMELVKRHIPEMRKFVSDTRTPAHYTAEVAKKECPDCITVFISPCTTKRKEGLIDPYIDYILNFVELSDFFDACKVDLTQCKDESFKQKSSTQGRNFPMSGSVAKAVETAAVGSKIIAHMINGINKPTIAQLKKYAKEEKCEHGNLIEVMSCPNGCIGGNACLKSVREAEKKINEYASKSFTLGKNGF